MGDLIREHLISILIFFQKVMKTQDWVINKILKYKPSQNNKAWTFKLFKLLFMFKSARYKT